ncbi:unnamed protein product [Spirodela intermedia]|uniref:Uncharacterized protein n=2 Tax=Spirodela intermedia TaxID=51605 RepID=A0A7I8KKX2_SPIIN|nr:unnamed protein product [Spirodela intermedia]CAA6662050.1 unnamed protein product [Spirodela intermedia]CAA7398433.1 unnamed protein product [Spirodela intermedia]
MVKLCTSLGFGAALAFSLVCSSSFSLTPSRSSLRFSSSASAAPPNPPPCPQRLAADLLSILGTRNEAAAVPKREAGRIWSCLKFLVPFSPVPGGYLRLRSEAPRNGRRIHGGPRAEEDEWIRWPPEPVLDLARIAVDSGGDPAAIQMALDPSVLQIPDVEGLKKDRCELTRTPYGRRFINEDLNAYLAFLFELIADRSPLVGLNISLNRYDLFHGHIFLAASTGRLGILFHAREYPAYEKEVFPYNMGCCQRGSCVVYDDSMNLRNILWLAPLPSNQTKAWLAPGVLVALDAHPGGAIYECLVSEYVDYVRTIYEGDFGDIVADINYFNIGNVNSSERIFIC